MIPTIETPRLILRGWQDEDLDSLAAMYADPEVMRFIGNGEPKDREGTASSIARFVAEWERNGFGLWAVEEKDTGAMIGRVGLHPHDLFPGDAEVGWLLAKDRWGRGLATEAGEASIRFAFETLGLPRVVSTAYPENAPSRRVMEKLGLTYRGDRDWDFVPGGKVVWYSLERAPS